MKHLFLARHGVYNMSDSRVNDEGKKGLGVLSEAIKNILHGSSAHIVSSTAPWAIDSAEILAVRLGIPGKIEREHYLWPRPSGSHENFSLDSSWDGVMELIEKRETAADGLILMSHHELFYNGFPSYYIHEKFGGGSDLGLITKGKAVHIDLEGKAYQIIPPK